jgi:hypothetical protein
MMLSQARLIFLAANGLKLVFVHDGFHFFVADDNVTSQRRNRRDFL